MLVTNFDWKFSTKFFRAQFLNEKIKPKKSEKNWIFFLQREGVILKNGVECDVEGFGDGILEKSDHFEVSPFSEPQNPIQNWKLD